MRFAEPKCTRITFCLHGRMAAEYPKPRQGRHTHSEWWSMPRASGVCGTTRTVKIEPEPVKRVTESYVIHLTEEFINIMLVIF